MSARTVTIKPNLPQRRDSEQLARWRSDVRNVPVTPAFGHEHKSLHGKVDPEAAGQDYFGLKPALHGNVISATFTVPHILYEKGKLQWVSSFSIADCYRCVLTVLGNWPSFLAFWACRLSVALVARAGPFATYCGGLDRGNKPVRRQVYEVLGCTIVYYH